MSGSIIFHDLMDGLMLIQLLDLFGFGEPFITPSPQRIFCRSSLRRRWGVIPSSVLIQRRSISRVKCLVDHQQDFVFCVRRRLQPAEGSCDNRFVVVYGELVVRLVPAGEAGDADALLQGF